MHGRPHSHIYCCADTVNDSHHWGPTQSVLKVSFGGNNSTQVSVSTVVVCVPVTCPVC